VEEEEEEEGLAAVLPPPTPTLKNAMAMRPSPTYLPPLLSVFIVVYVASKAPAVVPALSYSP